MGAIDSPAFQFYPKDFLTSERQIGMSAAESGIYMRLICHCWLSVTLPNIPRVLAKMAGVSDEEFSSCWPAVEQCFYVNATGRLQHARLDKEREKQEAFRAMQSEKGQKGAEKRWPRLQPGDTTATTEGMPGDSSSSSSPISDLLLRSPSSSPISNLQTSKRNTNNKQVPPFTEKTVALRAPDTAFDAFWRVYPKKVGKGAAQKAWTRINPPPETVALMLAAVKLQQGWSQWQKDDGQFIPHPSTWLNQGRWQDEGKPSGNGNGKAPQILSEQGRQNFANGQAAIAIIQGRR